MELDFSPHILSTQNSSNSRYTACGKFDQDQQVYVAKSGLSSHVSCSSVSPFEANMSHVRLAAGSSG